MESLYNDSFLLGSLPSPTSSEITSASGSYSTFQQPSSLQTFDHCFKTCGNIPESENLINLDQHYCSNIRAEHCVLPPISSIETNGVYRPSLGTLTRSSPSQSGLSLIDCPTSSDSLLQQQSQPQQQQSLSSFDVPYPNSNYGMLSIRTRHPIGCLFLAMQSCRLSMHYLMFVLCIVKLV